ncbi:MAG: methyltransferase domain-containing protein [Pseudomonadota bacterium]
MSQQGLGMESVWDRSAGAWLQQVGDEGDFSRKHVLDAPMLERVRASGAKRVLDVGCGEGRFCRMMTDLGLKATGIDPTKQLLEVAKAQGGSEYYNSSAEELPFWDGDFDLVVFYLSLIDIDGLSAAIREASRVLKTDGRILVANLSPWITASQGAHESWQRQVDGSVKMHMARYLESHSYRATWNGIDITNWHRSLSVYMNAFLSCGFRLTYFDEPKAVNDTGKNYDQAPYLYIMEWQKP